MKLLALSDIHSNLVAVRRMRALEANDFDAIVVAGDIGSNAARAFFEILATFECPVVYVFGNWDQRLRYRTRYGPAFQLLHLNVVTVGDLHFTGFSGCPTNWGQNPIAKRIIATTDGANRRILEAHRQALRKAIVRSKIDSRCTVIVTHERLTHLTDVVPNPLLHLFGHVHQFSQRRYKETLLVNVSALDRQITARPRNKRDWKPRDLRNFNAGNYATIEIDGAANIRVERIDLPHRYPEWAPLDGQRYNGIQWIDEERKWTDPSDPKLMTYHLSDGTEPFRGLP